MLGLADANVLLTDGSTALTSAKRSPGTLKIGCAIGLLPQG
jgi:hypothetical protein